MKPASVTELVGWTRECIQAWRDDKDYGDDFAGWMFHNIESADSILAAHDEAPEVSVEDVARVLYDDDPYLVKNSDSPDYGKPVPWALFWAQHIYERRARKVLALLEGKP